MEKEILHYYEAYGYPSTDKLYKLMKGDDVSVTRSAKKEFLSKKEEKQLVKQKNFKNVS